MTRPTKTVEIIVAKQVLPDTSIDAKTVVIDDLLFDLDCLVQEWRRPDSGDPPGIYSQEFMMKWGMVVRRFEELFGKVT